MWIFSGPEGRKAVTMTKALHALLPALSLAIAWPAAAHTPLFDCFADQDVTITCEAGFSDGGSAEGIEVRVVNLQGKVLAQDRIGPDNSVTFKRPEEDFSVVFAAGEGHEIRVFGEDIY